MGDTQPLCEVPDEEETRAEENVKKTVKQQNASASRMSVINENSVAESENKGSARNANTVSSRRTRGQRKNTRRGSKTNSSSRQSVQPTENSDENTVPHLDDNWRATAEDLGTRLLDVLHKNEQLHNDILVLQEENRVLKCIADLGTSLRDYMREHPVE